MRVLKDDTYQSILQAARDEFIRNGYKDTTMRMIAKKAHVGVSNIYHYFKNKDEIFLAIVQPAKDEIFTFITRQHTEESIDFTQISTLHCDDKAIESYIRLIDTYKQELCLLLYHSEGSSMKDFRDIFTDHITQVSNNYMALVKKYYPQANEVSSFFIHTLASWTVSILGEIVTHNLSRQKIREFFREHFKYEIAGWNELTGIKREAG